MMSEISYPELLEENRTMGEALADCSAFSVVFLANIMQPQFPEIMEYALRREGIYAVVRAGQYDSILQDSETVDEADALVVFWDASMLYGESPYALELEPPPAVDAFVDSMKARIDLLFRNAASVGCVLMNELFCAAHLMGGVRPSVLQTVCDDLNHYMRTVLPDNVTLVRMSELVGMLGQTDSLDLRLFYHGRSPDWLTKRSRSMLSGSIPQSVINVCAAA